MSDYLRKPASYVLVDPDTKSRSRTYDLMKDLGLYRLVKECNTALSANKVLLEEKVDLLIVDTNLPDMTVDAFLEILMNPPEVILTSNNRKEAILGYETDAADFLLKPFSFDRLMKALNRFQKQRLIHEGAGTDSHLAPDAFIYLEDRGRTHKLYIRDICFVEALNGQIQIQTEYGQISVRNSIQQIQHMLAPWPFIRIQSGLLVSMDKIDAFSFSMVELPNASLNIATKYREKVACILST